MSQALSSSCFNSIQVRIKDYSPVNYEETDPESHRGDQAC